MTRPTRKTPADRPPRGPRRAAARESTPQPPASPASSEQEAAAQEAPVSEVTVPEPSAPVAAQGAVPPRAPAKTSGSQPWLGWAAAILVVVLVLIGIALGVERLNDQTQRIGAEVQLTPIVGGMAVPTTPASSSGEPGVVVTDGAALTATGTLSPSAAVTDAATIAGTAAASGTATGGTAAGEAEPQVTVLAGPAPVFEPDTAVHNSSGDVLVYAEPSLEAQVLDSYAAGVALTVLEPGGDFTAYPVEVEGQGWVRVRAADGLVGWTPAAGLTPVD